MYHGKYIQAGNNANAGYLPEDTDKHLRDGLRQPVPQFGDRPWWRRRVCWYSDVPEGETLLQSRILTCRAFSLRQVVRDSESSYIYIMKR